MIFGCSTKEISNINMTHSDLVSEEQLEENGSVAVLTSEQENNNVKKEILYLYLSDYNVYKFLAAYNKYLIKEEDNFRAALIDAFPLHSIRINDFISKINNEINNWKYEDLLNYANQEKAMILIIEKDKLGNTSLSYEEWDGVTYLVSNYVDGNLVYDSEVELIEN